MKKFGIQGGYVAYDTLGDAELLNGQDVCVKWPDGKKTVQRVHVVATPTGSTENDEPFLVRHAFISVVINGLPVEIRLGTATLLRGKIV